MAQDKAATMNVRLRPLGEPDDPLIAALNEQTDVKDNLFSVERIPDDPPAYIRAIEVNGTATGVVGLVKRVNGGGFELVCALLTGHQGNRIGPEACRQVLSAEREKGSLDCVLASIAPENGKALALAKSLGFVQVAPKLWELRVSES